MQSSRRIQLSLSNVISSFARLLNGGGRPQEDDLAARFAAAGLEGDTLANSVLAVIVGCTVEMSLGTCPSIYIEPVFDSGIRPGPRRQLLSGR